MSTHHPAEEVGGGGGCLVVSKCEGSNSDCTWHSTALLALESNALRSEVTDSFYTGAPQSVEITSLRH